MRGLVAVTVAVLLFAAASPASAQFGPGRPFIPLEAFYTPPLVPTSGFTDSEFEASFVSIGSAPVELTILFCHLDGICTAGSFSACVSVPLTKGKGCTATRTGLDPLYAKFLLKKTGTGTVDGLGSLGLTSPDGEAKAAVQTIRSGALETLVTDITDTGSVPQ